MQTLKYKQVSQIIKIVVVSDTHNCHPKKMPSGDIFIHCGDFTSAGSLNQLKNFYNFLDRLQFKHKIVIAGNHDLSLDKNLGKTKNLYYKKSSNTSQQIISELKKHCIYLQHEFIQVQGIRIFGSPYTPTFYDWAFMYQSDEAAKIWDLGQQKVDIMVTHGPPYGILDFCGLNAGCPELLKTIKRLKPKYHFFGHIHEGFGNFSTKDTKYYNCSYLNQRYCPLNKVVQIDYIKQKI